MGYGNPPWDFKGQALYQLSLVKVEDARKYVPPELPLVNLFGWTLGGFYLARYTDSPVGAFDELVALAGLVWNFPTSCAWAARVYVNNRAARDHGVSSVGLPSRLAAFKAVPLPALTCRGGSDSGHNTQTLNNNQNNNNNASTKTTWWDLANNTNKTNNNGDLESPIGAIELLNIDSKRRLLPLSFLFGNRQHSPPRSLSSPVCTIPMPHVPSSWAPTIQMFLPSFSGATPDFPDLLKYSLKLNTQVRFLPSVRVRVPKERPEGDRESGEVLDAVLAGRPLVCMAFNNMSMEVQPPKKWAPRDSKHPHVHQTA